MKRAVLFVIIASLLAACSDDKPRPLTEPGEKLYIVRGMVISRDREENSLKLDHEAIPGFMEAMTMDYKVRGAEVDKLPADKTRIEARLHVTDRSYWITDVKRIP